MMEREDLAAEGEEEYSEQSYPFPNRKIEIMQKILLNGTAVIMGYYGVAE
jgi:hypothetical protein